MDRQLYSEEFESYRKAEVEKLVPLIRQLIQDKVSTEFFSGAIFIIKSIINLPEELARTKEDKEQAKLLREQMMSQVEAQTLRAFLC